MLEINKCKTYFLKKNGQFRFYPDSMYQFVLLLCVLNNDILYKDFEKIEILGKNNREINEKKNILKEIIKSRLMIYKIKNKKSDYFCIFKEENINQFLKLVYLEKKFKTSKKKEEILIINFIIYKLMYKNYTNTDIFTMLFFFTYIKLILPFIKKKYSKNFLDFSNYHDLYIFLEKIGLVKIFYNGWKPYILKNYKKIYEKIISNPDFEIFKKKEIKKIEYFK